MHVRNYGREHPILKFVWLAIGTCVAVGSANAMDGTGIAVVNQYALAQPVGLPVLAVGSVAEHRSIRFDWTNDYTTAFSDSESLILDGETRRVTFSASWLVGERFELGVKVPLVSIGGGLLDSSIEGWHEFTGLPDGKRHLAPRNRLFYRYQVNGADRLFIDDSYSGLGDIQLTLGRNLSDDGQTVLRSSLEVPTGSATHLTGNSAFDWAVWLDHALWASSSNWNGAVSLGGVYVGQGRVLEELQRHFVAVAAFGLTRQFYGRSRLKAQAYAHSPLYSGSTLEQLNNPALQGALGFDYLSEDGKRRYDFALVQDAITDTSADLTLHFGVTWIRP